MLLPPKACQGMFCFLEVKVLSVCYLHMMCRRVKTQRLSVHVCCVLDHASVCVYLLVPLFPDLHLNFWPSTYVLLG